jgi:beta-galactosidase
MTTWPKHRWLPQVMPPFLLPEVQQVRYPCFRGNKAETVLYTVNNGKANTYKNSFDLRQGGTITAWYQGNEKLKVTQQYSKIETVPMEVVFTSSQETGEGDAKNLLDGDPSSIWHTMYSVTVAQYPHWVDFDAASVKTIKGFTFLPRPDGANGDIKDYKIQVSKDGKNWEDVLSGTFERNKKLKTVRFEKPVKGPLYPLYRIELTAWR